ncbi:hypothetical protein I3760_14G034300 [Carya illinoinensis]|nr:hypothetical protein I3760_14G034300 [Carya illinoinensis]
MRTPEESMSRNEELRMYKAPQDRNSNDNRVIRESQTDDEARSERITNEAADRLHNAVANGQGDIVKELVDSMSAGNLAIYDSDGYTALITAAVLGNLPMVQCMLQKCPGLISIRDSIGNSLPVVMAIDFGQIEMARHLYELTPKEDLIPEDNDQRIQDHNGATLLTCAIYAGTLDIALGLIKRCPRLALAIDKYRESPILALASMRHYFPSGNQLGFQKQRIYSRLSAPPTNDEARLNVSNGEQCQSNQGDQNNISSLSAPPTNDEARLNVSNEEQCQSNQEDQNNISVLSANCCYLGSRVLDFFGITQLYEMKKIHVQSNELLSRMCHVISESNMEQLQGGLVYTAICRAAKNGIVEFVSEMLNTNRKLVLWTRDINGRNIFMLGVLHRQEKIFSVLYRLDGKMSHSLTCLEDKYGNNMLHMAGMIDDSARINQISGAALQMQRELQWFKEVERIVHPKDKEAANNSGVHPKDKEAADNSGLTPRQLFTKSHKNMMEKGEKWMKNTATSCMVVGALIVTIMFTVAFTIPGGNNQTTSFPIFLKKKLFMLFIISDALSLFSSSTSVLMFLGILTSRYAEEDFLEYLPRQMIIGLLTLFCSLATMMITFSSALLIILHEQLHIAVPLICLASVPVTFFVWIQFPILKDMIISTYGPGMFDKKMKSKSI